MCNIPSRIPMSSVCCSCITVQLLPWCTPASSYIFSEVLIPNEHLIFPTLSGKLPKGNQPALCLDNVL